VKLVPLKCPSCSANLELPGDRESAFCTYCGTKILITSEAAGPNLQSIVKLADATYDAGNTQEALLLYNRALEVQPSSSHAWTRRALCTSGETRAGEIRARFKEAAAYLNRARESDSPNLEEIEKAREKIRNDMAHFANIMTARSAESAQQVWSGDYLG